MNEKIEALLKERAQLSNEIVWLRSTMTPCKEHSSLITRLIREQVRIDDELFKAELEAQRIGADMSAPQPESTVTTDDAEGRTVVRRYSVDAEAMRRMLRSVGVPVPLHAQVAIDTVTPFARGVLRPCRITVTTKEDKP